MGIDGDFSLSFEGLNVLIHDFTSGPLPDDIIPPIDLGWCVEVLEHVEEQYLENMRTAFQLCRRLWVTHALPGKRGWHHVNCREPSYWEARFKTWGFRVNHKASRMLRSRSTMAKPFSRNTGMLIERMD